MRSESLHVYRPEGNGMNGELLGSNSVGLQARFLTGNFHEPLLLTKEQIQGISENGVEEIGQDLGRRYQNASLKQRREYQQAKNLTYEMWRTRFDAYLQSIRNDTKHTDRKAFLETIGISDDLTAEDFYREYLQGGSQVVRFVGDVESSASTEQIKRHADIIRGLGNTFGYATSAVIEHLIHGVRNAKNYTDEFIESVSGSANVPRTLHNPLLRVIHDDSDSFIENNTSSYKTAALSARRSDRDRQAILFSDLANFAGESDRDPPPRSNKPTENVSSSVTDAARAEREAVRQERPSRANLRVLFREPEPKREERDRKQQGTSGSGGGDQGEITFIPLDLPVARRPHTSPPPPAPLQESEREYDADPLTDKEIGLAMRYLSYSDINPPPDETPSDDLADSSFTKQYIREFVAMTAEYGKPLVLETAIDAGELVGELLDAVELERTPVSRSPSWYLWYAAQSRFLSNHPHIRVTLRDADRYHPFDPLIYKNEGATREQIIQSRQANGEIIDRMLGWEIYRQRRKKISVFRHLDPAYRDEWEKLQVLLNEEPKDDGTNTLSSDRLIEIGRIVRTGVSRE